MDLRTISGVSEHIKNLHREIEKAAKNDDTVLIMGPTGTGKELVANNIHFLSNRKDKPYSVVNCGGIPDGLFESEMFGHEKGSFTGAIAKRKGHIKAAEGGTLFLDEIGNLKDQNQGALLRFLQDKSYSPVGSEKRIDANVRIICATNRNLRKEIKEKKFKDDLYARLSQQIIETEPLKNRPEDAVVLLHEKNPKADPKAKFLLYSYDWPLNVRDLENYASKDYAYIREQFIRQTSILIGKDIPDETPLPLYEIAFGAAEKGQAGGILDLLVAINIVDTWDLDFKKLIHAYEAYVLISAGLSNDDVAEALHIRREKLSKYQDYFGIPLPTSQPTNVSDFIQDLKIRSAFIK